MEDVFNSIKLYLYDAQMPLMDFIVKETLLN